MSEHRNRSATAADGSTDHSTGGGAVDAGGGEKSGDDVGGSRTVSTDVRTDDAATHDDTRRHSDESTKGETPTTNHVTTHDDPNEDDEVEGTTPSQTERTQQTATADHDDVGHDDDAGDDDELAAFVESLDLPPEGLAIREEVLADVRAWFDAQPDTPFEDDPSDAFLETSFFDFSYLRDYEEIERRWVNEPYAYVSICYSEADREYVYFVNEPALDDFERYVRQDLVDFLRTSLMYEEVDDDVDKSSRFEARASDLIAEHAATVDPGSLHKLLYYLRRDFVEFGPIDAIMRDPAIEDVSCDGSNVPVYVYHRDHRDLETNVVFDKRHLNSFTVRLAQRSGKQISVSEPLLDATLSDGSRLQLTLGGDVSTRGSNFTIRKFSDVPLTPVDLVNFNTFSVEEMAYFWLAIENNKSLMFVGGTGCGKTTSMNAVSFFIPPSSKIVSIEDTREIDLPHDNWVQSVTRDSMSAEGRGEVTMYELLQAALRQRPEYIVVGEIRTEQRVALTFFQAMGTGHTCYTTLHADSVEAVLNRLQNPPLSVPMGMIQDLDVVSIQRQLFLDDRRVRRTEQITELVTRDGDPNTVRTIDVFRRDPETDEQRKTGDSEVMQEIADQRGWDARRLRTELDNRQRVLEYLIDNDVTDHEQVAGLIMLYNKDPSFVMAQLDAEDPLLGILERP